MKNLELLRVRRSVRVFQNKSIPKELLEKMVDAARFAPTARNVQPWEFVVITQKSKLKELAQLAENGRFIEQAAACIAVFCVDTKYYLEDGCDNFCSYCKVALVRGRERSKKLTEIIKEAKALVSRGYQEIVLTGICLGAYGKGLPHRKDLVDVIDALEKIKGLSRIRLSSIEAGDVSLKLIRRMRKSKKLCRHLHIPIQSGDDAILKRMNRKYTSQKYLELISKIKSAVPGVAITTDVLVGFPGESEENFQNTVDLVQKIQPLKVHIFPYSPREGTAAAKIGDGSHFRNSRAGLNLPYYKREPPPIKDRISRLKAVAEKCSLAYKKRFLNKSLEVLLEARDKQNPLLWEGLTDNYLKVIIKGTVLFPENRPLILKNKIVLVRLLRIIGDSFIGEMLLDLLCL